MMAKRGKKSAAELSTVVIDAGRKMPPRAPAELTDAQAAVWRDTAGSLPGDWLVRGGFPVLVEYCRRVCRSRLLEGMVAAFQAEWIKEDGGLERLDKLLAAADRESRGVVACARALRLTPQSQMHPRSAGRGIANMPGESRPWDRTKGGYVE